MSAWSRASAFLRRHKKNEVEAVEAAGLTIAWRVLARTTGVFAAGVASAAVLAPQMIDLSNNNGSRAASAISARGVVAVEAKATEGLSFRDPTYATFRAAAARAHRAFGGYFFIHPDTSGKAQADYFLAYAQPKPGDIEPVIDSETGSPASAAAATYAALRELQARGYDPILYASTSYLATLVATDRRIAAFRAWDAEYGPVLHHVPGVTDVAWQFTDRATANGFSLDGSHLLVRSIDQLTIPKPAPKQTPAQKRAAALRAETGYWPWLAWYIGEQAWKPYGPRNATVRPHVAPRVPASWWRREREFLAART